VFLHPSLVPWSTFLVALLVLSSTPRARLLVLCYRLHLKSMSWLLLLLGDGGESVTILALRMSLLHHSGLIANDLVSFLLISSTTFAVGRTHRCIAGTGGGAWQWHRRVQRPAGLEEWLSAGGVCAQEPNQGWWRHGCLLAL